MNTSLTTAARLGQFAVCVILLFAVLALVAAAVAQAQRRRRDRARPTNRLPVQGMTTALAGCAFEPIDDVEPEPLRHYRERHRP